MQRKSFIWLAALVALIAAGSVTYRSHRKHEKALATAQKKAVKAAKPRKFQRAATPVIPRNGLPKLTRKVHAKEPLKVAFLGGSITQNASRGGFVAELKAWLERSTPGVSVDVVNAGIAGTGSDFGAQRVDRDVLEYFPDVVFVEFAVNDSDRECTADMERIVRKTRLANPETDLVFIYTVTSDSLPMLERGKFPPSVLWHERVAEHYSIPTVALGSEAARKIRANEWTWSNFSADTCHPTPAGYGSYNTDITAALELLLKAPAQRSGSLPPSITPDLLLRPPPATAVEQPDPAPLADRDGMPALETSELPLFGVHWIETPAFGNHWELFYRPLNRTVPVAQDRPTWKRARWFEELRWFTGSTSHALARSSAESENFFGSSPAEAAVLTWRARTKGRHTVRVIAAALEGPRASEDATCHIHLLHFPHGESSGSTLATEATDGAFDFTRSLNLEPGDELAFAIDPRGYKFAHYRGFRVTIGYFGEAPTP